MPRRSFAIPTQLPWKRIAVAAVLVAEVLALSLISWSARATPDGIAVRADQAAVTASDQKAVTSSVRIDRVVAPGPSWVVVMADDGTGVPGRVLGSAPVNKGEVTDVNVPLQAGVLPKAALAMLVSDMGVPGVLEYSGQMQQPAGGMGSAASEAADADRPYVADGAYVSTKFAIEPLSFTVGSTDATISAATRDASGASVTASGVVAPAPSWLSVSLVTTSGAPGEVLAYSAVPAGSTATVTVPLPAAAAGQALAVVLHADLGRAAQFEYSIHDAGNSPDQPYIAGGQTVQVAVPPKP